MKVVQPTKTSLFNNVTVSEAADAVDDAKGAALMRERALDRVRAISGWGQYGGTWREALLPDPERASAMPDLNRRF